MDIDRVAVVWGLEIFTLQNIFSNILSPGRPRSSGGGPRGFAALGSFPVVIVVFKDFLGAWRGQEASCDRAVCRACPPGAAAVLGEQGERREEGGAHLCSVKAGAGLLTQPVRLDAPPAVPIDKTGD